MKASDRTETLHLLCALCLGWFLVLLYFYPILTANNSAIPSSFPDGKVFTWNFWWAQLAIREGRSIFETNFVFHPFGALLHLHTFVPAFTIPMAFLFPNADPAALFSSACILAFLLNFACALMLFRSLSGSVACGAVLALLVAFHPYFIGHLRGGHLNMLAFFPVLLLAGGLAKIFLHTGMHFSFRIAAALAILSYSCLYYLYFSAILLGFACIWLFLNRPVERRSSAGRIAVSALAGLALGLPMLLPAAGQALSQLYTPDHSPRAHSADLLSYFLPSENQALGTLAIFKPFQSMVRVNSAEAGATLSVSLILLLLLLYRQRGLPLQRNLLLFSVLGSVAFAVLGLGPVIDMRGAPLRRTFIYDWCIKLLPFFPSVPARFSIMALLLLTMALALLLNVSACGDTSLKRRLLIKLLLAFAILELCPAWLMTTDVKGSSALTMLRDNADIHAVHDTGTPHDSMLRQIYHGKVITNAFLARQPKAALASYRQNAFRRYISGARLDVKPQDLFAAWNELKIDALIVEQSDLETRHKVSTTPWLSEILSDNNVAIYAAASR